jgi:glycosyltransferase involved in cell wall biosynthesis
MRLAGVAPLLPEKTDPQGFRVRHGLGQKPMVLFIGRMVETKGVKALLAAAPYIWQRIPDAQFIFIGNHDGQSPTWFAERHDDRIRHLGPVEEQERGDALAACDLFCMPSVAEILPAVYLEAWSYGKAVIGGTAYGLKELIEENGAGLTVEQDPVLLASRVIELLQNETKRRSMGDRGRELVERRFSKSSVVGALERAYAEIAGA